VSVIAPHVGLQPLPRPSVQAAARSGTWSSTSQSTASARVSAVLIWAMTSRAASRVRAKRSRRLRRRRCRPWRGCAGRRCGAGWDLPSGHNCLGQGVFPGQATFTFWLRRSDFPLWAKGYCRGEGAAGLVTWPARVWSGRSRAVSTTKTARRAGGLGGAGVGADAVVVAGVFAEAFAGPVGALGAAVDGAAHGALQDGGEDKGPRGRGRGRRRIRPGHSRR
jgi:hypothetical protein